MANKKILLSSLLLLALVSFGTVSSYAAPVQAATVTKAKTTAKVTWAASGLKEINKIPNKTVRAAFKAKVEKYAISKKIKTITSAVVRNMRA